MVAGESQVAATDGSEVRVRCGCGVQPEGTIPDSASMAPATRAWAASLTASTSSVQ